MTKMDTQSAANFLAEGYISELQLIAQGSSKKNSYLSNGTQSGCRWGNGTYTTPIPSDRTVEPNECEKSGTALEEFPPTSLHNMGQLVLAAVANLPTASFLPPKAKGINFHQSWNDNSMIGYLIDYSKGNINVCFSGPPYPTLKSDGSYFGIFSACPVTLPFSGRFDAADMNVNHALGVNAGAIPSALYQGINLYLRGGDSNSLNYALQQLNAVAALAKKVSSNPMCIGFGNPPYTGRALGAFLHLARILGVTPKLPTGITMADVEATIYNLQQQTGDGSVPDGYTTLTGAFTGDPIEATNVCLLAHCTSLQAKIRNVHNSKKYNFATLPPATYTGPI